MASTAQALANAANAQKSTGPRTTTGKSNSSKNSLSHGLHSEASTLFAHSPYLAAEFDKFRAQLLEVPAQGIQETLAFDRWAFSAFQATRARELEALAESDARANFGDEAFERRWQRLLQSRLRLERDAATARKEFFALQNERLCLEAEQAAAAKRCQSDKVFLQALREKAKERDRAYQNALLAYQQRLAAAPQNEANPENIAPPPVREPNLDLVYLSAPDRRSISAFSAEALESCRPRPIDL